MSHCRRSRQRVRLPGTVPHLCVLGTLPTSAPAPCCPHPQVLTADSASPHGPCLLTDWQPEAEGTQGNASMHLASAAAILWPVPAMLADKVQLVPTDGA